MTRSLLTQKQQQSLADQLSQIIQFKDDCVVGCDCTLKHTRRILRELHITGQLLEDVLDEIQNGGGYCDCEVLSNYLSSPYSQLPDDV